jgi:Aromatic-ring-opening dioxygenase LigAB, LigA subunit
MRDYELSKLFFDLQTPSAAAEYRAHRDAVLARYPLKPEVRAAIENNDVAALAPLVNAYLLRFYFLVSGMPEEEFLRRIRSTARTGGEKLHG